MKKAALALILPAILLIGATAQGEAEYDRWELGIEYGTPDYVLLEDAMGNARVCWYLTYTVSNDTGADVPLKIKITADTDTDKHYRDSIAPLAQKALEKKTGKKLKNALAMSRGTIGAGEKVEAVAFFGEIDPNWDLLTVNVAGLYDTIDVVDGKLFFEVKVLVLTWSRPGDEFGCLGDPITFKAKKWIIEGERKEVPQTPRE